MEGGYMLLMFFQLLLVSILCLCGVVVGFSILCHAWTRRNGLEFHRDEEGNLMVSHTEARKKLGIKN